MKKKKIEIFSAGCLVCEETIHLIKNLSCPSCEIQVLDMEDEAIAAKAKKLGIHTVPAVVINGKLASCCKGKVVDEIGLREAGNGTP